MKENVKNEFEDKLNELNNLLSIRAGKFNSSELLITAENLLSNNFADISAGLWHKYLNLTRYPFFLINLKSREI